MCARGDAARSPRPALLAWYATLARGRASRRCARRGWRARTGWARRIRVRLPRDGARRAFSPGSTTTGALLLDGRRGAPRASPRPKSFRRRSCEERAMLLAINANNTNTVFAIWDGEQLQGRVARRHRCAPHRRRICGVARPSARRWQGCRARRSTAPSSPASCPRPISTCAGCARDYCKHRAAGGRRAGRRDRRQGAGRPARGGRRRPPGQHRGGA